MRSQTFALSVAALLAAAVSARALDPKQQISQYAHGVWRLQDGWFTGLPNVITQTADGYLWVGTDSGLLRFNGARFDVWTSPSGQSLPRADVYSLLGAKDGSLWIGTGRGLVRLKDGNLTAYPHTDRWVNSILQDRAGAIWIARSNGEVRKDPLCRVWHEQVRCFGKADGITIPTARRLTLDPAGNLWIGGFKGLCRWSPESAGCFFEKELSRSAGLIGVEGIAADSNGSVWAGIEGSGSGRELQRMVNGVWKSFALPGMGVLDSEVSALLMDRSDALWIGTRSKGIYRVRGDQVDHFFSHDGLSSDAVAGFYEDREGTLWVATSKGIDSFREVPVTSFSMREGLTADSVSTVLAGRDGTVWMGNSGALDYLSHDKLRAIRERHGLPGRNVTTLFEDHLGQLWLGVDSGLWIYAQGRFRAIMKAGRAIGIVFAITEDTAHHVWVRAGDTLLRIDGERVTAERASPSISKTYALAADPTGGIWLGLVNGDLARYRDGRMAMFSASQGSDTGQARGLLVDPDGAVWAATQIGLVRLKDGRRKLLTTRNGLPCDAIYSLVKDDLGSLWLYTKCGLVAIRESDLKQWWAQPDRTVHLRTFDVFDGAQPGLTPLQPQASKSPDGRLWFANKSVLQMVDPRRLGRNSVPPAVHIERLTADKTEYAPREGLHLPPRTRDVEIEYAALSFVSVPKIQYRYKLEGYDRNWQEPHTRRQAVYSGLPPSRYRFRVIACNNEGVWNESGAMLNFSVDAAWYQAAWFRMLSLGFGAFVVWGVYQLRVWQIAAGIHARFDERLTERTRLARELHDTLLQTIQASKMIADSTLDGPADPVRMRREMARLSIWLAQASEEGRSALNSLRTSTSQRNNLAEALRTAGEQHMTRNAMGFALSVAGATQEMHPIVRDEVYRIGYEAIRNAYHHSGGSHVEVELLYAQSLTLRVRDDGQGIDPETATTGKTGHFGLQGMRERAARIGGRLSVTRPDARGTQVELIVPGHVIFADSRPGIPRLFAKLFGSMMRRAKLLIRPGRPPL